MFNTLRSNLTIVFITLAVVPILIVSGVLAWLGQQTLSTEAINSQTSVARLASSEIETFVTQKTEQLRLLANVRRLTTLDLQAQKGLLDTLLNYDDAYKELALLDTQGQELLRLSRDESFTQDRLLNRADEEIFLQPVASEDMHISPVRFDDTTGEPLLDVSLPIINLRTGAVDLVLVAELRFSPIWDLLTRANFGGDNGVVYMVDDSGIIVAHPNSSVVLRGDRANIPEANGLGMGLSGERVILAYEELQFDDQHFTVIAERNADDALQLVNIGLQIVIGVTSIVLLSAIFALGYLLRRIARPIEQLSTTAQQISQGDRSARAKEEGLLELAELAESFNTMVAMVQQREQGAIENASQLQQARDEALSAKQQIEVDSEARRRAEEERTHLQQQLIEAQQAAIRELSTPIIPVMDRVIIIPLIGTIDTTRARDITRTLLDAITRHQARVVILDITGVSVVDSEVAGYLNKTIQAARLKGAHTVVTGISDAVAETIVDLGIDWSMVQTVSNLQAGLQAALQQFNGKSPKKK